MRPLYYGKTIGYHVWGVFERHDRNLDESVVPESALDYLIETIGARGRGDAAARAKLADRVETLNRGRTAQETERDAQEQAEYQQEHGRLTPERYRSVTNITH